MAAFVECIPCQHGFHDEHHEIVQHAPEGGVGGAKCPCKGECRDRPQPSLKVPAEAIEAGLRAVDGAWPRDAAVEMRVALEAALPVLAEDPEFRALLARLIAERNNGLMAATGEPSICDKEIAAHVAASLFNKVGGSRNAVGRPTGAAGREQEGGDPARCNAPQKEAAKASGCTCTWARRDKIVEFDPDCPILSDHIVPGPVEDTHG